jgi:hypothetical protein
MGTLAASMAQRRLSAVVAAGLDHDGCCRATLHSVAFWCTTLRGRLQHRAVDVGAELQHQMKNVLRLLGFGLILGGLICMPFPVTNPEATTSIFPWLAMNGGLVKFGAWAMA